MRTFLIVLVLVTLVSANGSQGKHRATRNKGNLVLGAGRANTRASYDIRHHTKEHRASMARFVVHNSKGMAMGTNTPHGQKFSQFVGVNAELLTDIIDGESTGTPYVYINKNDFTDADLHRNNHASMLFSRVVVDNYCDNLPLYAKDPYCARAVLLGKIVHVTNSTEHAAALKSLTDKYPGFKNVNANDYELGKMNVEVVLVPGEDGKPEEIPLEMYRAASPDYTEDPEPESTTVKFG